jgi:pteridine reductase
MHEEPDLARTAVVTGGAVRLGRAIAIALAEDGYDVVVHYNRSDGAARETAARIEALGVRATVKGADLSDPEGPAALIRHVTEQAGRLDLLVNSASTYARGRVDAAGVDVWDRAMAVNARAPFLLVREAAPLLKEAGGAVVNIVDLSAMQAWRERGIHAVSKAALLHLTRVQARTMAPDVRVNAIAPGNVLPPEEDDEADTEAYRRRTPLARIGSPEDVERAVRYLAEAPHVTGTVLVVDGGRIIEP